MFKKGQSLLEDACIGKIKAGQCSSESETAIICICGHSGIHGIMMKTIETGTGPANVEPFFFQQIHTFKLHLSLEWPSKQGSWYVLTSQPLALATGMPS